MENLSGVVETQVRWWGTLEKISTHIFSHRCMHTRMCALALFITLFVSISLQAGIVDMKFLQDMEEAPGQHAAPCNGNHRYPLRIGHT